MQICLVAHKIGFNDGPGRVNYELAMAILAAGHTLTIVSSSCSENIVRHPNTRFIQICKQHLPTQLLRTLVFATVSTRWFKKHYNEFDIVQVTGFVCWEPADIVAVHCVHGEWLKSPYYPFHWKSCSPYAWYQRIYTLVNAHLERRVFRCARKIIAVSRGTADSIARLRIPPRPIEAICNGVNTDEFYPRPESARQERSAFGLPEDVRLALFVGDIRTSRKNLGTVLAALRIVPGAHLAVAGSTFRSPFPEMARTLGVADRVHFLGCTTEVPALMRTVELFVFPSHYKACSLVVLEAMASGLPAIISANAAAMDAVTEVCRVLSDPDDTEELARNARHTEAGGTPAGR